MVFDVPAEHSRALSVLKDFYKKFNENKNNEYIFVLSLPELAETENIKVIRFPWIKKSWFHRLYFDHCVAPKLIDKYKPDEVLSLQNVVVPRTKTFQTLYVHNALPFSEYRFSFFEDKMLWVYQNILSRMIFKSIGKADKVIVQTKWMKKKCVEMLSVDEEKIEVMPPDIKIDVKKRYSKPEGGFVTFFYPANSTKLKNHTVVVEACRKLKSEGIGGYKIVFTLTGSENKHISNIKHITEKEDLPIEFIGKISRDEVFEYYSRSVLLFPSFVETVGIPLIEAKLHGSPIIVSDCPFSREILNEYDNIAFFDPFDVGKIKIKMSDNLKNKIQNGLQF
jgi:glycosyltransferase involved in cell wall biosynthesis